MVPTEISGAECKALRKRLKLTQQEFADKLGVCRSLVVRAEKGTPTLLLSRMVLGLIYQEKNESLQAQLRSMTEQNKAMARTLKGGEHVLAEEVARLQKENADLRTAIQVMMTVRERRR